MRKILLVLTLTILKLNLVGQVCRLEKNKSISLEEIAKNSLNCKEVEIIKYCLRFEKSKEPSFYLWRCLMRDSLKNSLFDSDPSKSQGRLMRFSTLYYVHHFLITHDTLLRNEIVLKTKSGPVHEACGYRPYKSSDERKRQLFEETHSYENDNKDIFTYYNILRCYVSNYEKWGKEIAYKKYKEALDSNGLVWYYGKTNLSNEIRVFKDNNGNQFQCEHLTGAPDFMNTSFLKNELAVFLSRDTMFHSKMNFILDNVDVVESNKKYSIRLCAIVWDEANLDSILADDGKTIRYLITIDKNLNNYRIVSLEREEILAGIQCK